MRIETRMVKVSQMVNVWFTVLDIMYVRYYVCELTLDWQAINVWKRAYDIPHFPQAVILVFFVVEKEQWASWKYVASTFLIAFLACNAQHLTACALLNYCCAISICSRIHCICAHGDICTLHNVQMQIQTYFSLKSVRYIAEFMCRPHLLVFLILATVEALESSSNGVRPLFYLAQRY